MRRRRRRRRDRRARGRARAGAAPRRRRGRGARARAGDRRPPDEPLQRRHPRRDLLRARLAEGAALRRRRRASSTSTATSAGSTARRTGKLIVATARAELPGSTSSSGAGAANGVPGLRRLGAARDRARSSRTPPGSPACTRPRPGSSTSPRSPRASPTTSTARRRHGARPAARSSRSPSATGGVTVEPRRGTTRGPGASSSAPGPGRTGSRVAAGRRAEPRIVPFRGAYLRLRPERARARPRERLPGPRPRPAVPRRPSDPRLRRRRSCSAPRR